MHWLKQACRKGDSCEYLHRWIEDRIPICKFFQQNGHCHIQEQCVYRHPKPEDVGATKKQEPCPYFEKGFCKLGREHCLFWHGHELEPQAVCENYLLGFCPDGPNCEAVHVRSLLSPQDLSLSTLANFPREEDWIDSKIHIT